MSLDDQGDGNDVSYGEQRGMRGKWDDEIDRIRAEMLRLREAGDTDSPTLRRLEDVNQAVSWARGDECKSPFDLVMGGSVG